MKRRALCSLLIIGLLSLTAGYAAEFARNPSGISLEVGTTHVDIAIHNDHTFRLSINLDGPAAARKSIYLDERTTAKPPGWQTISEGFVAGVKTAFGQLTIDTKSGEWTLKDKAGQVLVGRGDLGKPTSEKSFALYLDGLEGEPFLAYGSGNRTPGLQQRKSTTGMIGGVTGMPQYWCVQGYSALAVTESDNQPAEWESQAEASGVQWSIPGRRVDLYLTPAENLKEAASTYAQLTGHPPVPPRWAFGYLQSRWGWKDRADVQNVLKSFQDERLPVDAFIYDFEWYATTPDYLLTPQGLKDFTDFRWNPVLFPKPAKQIAEDRALGIQTVVIRKPRMGNADTLVMMLEKGWIVSYERQGLNPANEPDLNQPPRRVLDFENPETRKWYTEQTIPLVRDGVAGWWNDEGEGTYATYYYWNMAEIDAQNAVNPNQRFWSINRGFSPGLQRLGAGMWNGDIQTGWKSMAETPESLLNLSVAGVSYVTCDNGGFIGGDPDPKCFTRWMQMSVFFPGMRSHGERTLTPRFPWLYGEEALNGIRAALHLRYRLIPYYYSLAHETQVSGVPMMRPMVMEFPTDKRFATVTDQWMMGGSLLAAPILTETDTREVLLPEGKWFALGTKVVVAGGGSQKVQAKFDETVAFVKAGSILPLGPVVESTSQLSGSALEVQVYPGADATFVLVEDDGMTKGYLKGEVRRTTFRWDDGKRTLTWASEGGYQGKEIFRNARVVAMDSGKEMKADLGTSGEVRLRR